MKSRSSAWCLVVAGAVLAGCGQSTVPGWIAGKQDENVIKTKLQHSVSLTVKPVFKPAGLYKAQALVSAFRAADVSLLKIVLFQVSGTTETLVAEVDLTQGDLSSDVVFSGLAPNSDYRVVSTAYKGEEVISFESSMPIHVGTDTDLAPISLTVHLKDTAFNGSTSTNLTIVDGYLVPAGPATISVEPTPAPAATPGPEPTPPPAEPTPVPSPDGGTSPSPTPDPMVSPTP